MYAPTPPVPGLPPVRVNIYSDTQTKPSAAMKAAMMEAEVGDEQNGLDPTVNLLCARVAALLGKEAAVFLPSGTMCNQIAMLVHCRPGDEILAHQTAHLLNFEAGGAAGLAGAQVRGLPGPRGQYEPATLAAAFIPGDRHGMAQTLVAVEQTANLGGGSVWPVERLHAVAELAHARGIATHMDGARLMNAVVAAGVAAADMAAGYDSVWIDFTKGLGAPLGAVLSGSTAFIDRAWRFKQRLGGALRQGGICAAACLYALDHNVERLAEDHANASLLARGLARIEGVSVVPPETNLVFLDIAGTGRTAADLAARLRQGGIMISVMGPTCLRACTHLDVDRAGVAEAVAAMQQALMGCNQGAGLRD
jgi:threonine aldolase